MKKDIIEVVTDALLMVMAGSLLYLYFIGAWDEPCLPILITELTILTATIGFAIWRFVRYIAKKEDSMRFKWLSWFKFMVHWYVWAFGAIFMTMLGVFVIMPLLQEHNQWIVIIGLCLYIPTSLIKFWDDAMKLPKK